MSSSKEKPKKSTKASTSEYRKQREKNNEQVRRSRQKKQQEEKFIENAVEENDKKIKSLEKVIHQLTNELATGPRSNSSNVGSSSQNPSSYSKKEWHGDPF